MTFLRITDVAGNEQLLNPSYVVRARLDRDRLAVWLAGEREPLWLAPADSVRVHGLLCAVAAVTHASYAEVAA